MKTLKLKRIQKSHLPAKKYDAVFEKNGREKTIPFGARGMSDFTKHKDKTRKQRYLKRHSGMGEHWNRPDTAGALSRWVLWNKKTLKASIADYKRRFRL
jgi:hypothetical protein